MTDEETKIIIETIGYLEGIQGGLQALGHPRMADFLLPVINSLNLLVKDNKENE